MEHRDVLQKLKDATAQLKKNKQLLKQLQSSSRWAFEENAQKQGYRLIAGVDEAGRGPLAGPVVAAACIVPNGFDVSGIDDSKKLSPKQREFLFHRISSSCTTAVGIVEAPVIDVINILQASIQAMIEAVKKLVPSPDYLLVDGLTLPFSIPSEKIIKGDALSFSIGAASIIAKVTRDRIMEELDAIYPQYGFKKHKGYGTAVHLKALQEHGPCPIHRKTFEPIKGMLCGV